MTAIAKLTAPEKTAIKIDRMDHAIQILSKTNDGDDLAPQHLKLLENVVNDRASKDGLKAFDDLFAELNKKFGWSALSKWLSKETGYDQY